MLELIGKTAQSVTIGDNIQVTIIAVEGDQVRIGISATASANAMIKGLRDEETTEGLVRRIKELLQKLETDAPH